MSAPVPDLPAVPEDDSMLTRKFGREVANYFSGSPLNRVSFLRTDYGFLAAAFAHPGTRVLAMDGLAPLARDPARLAYLAPADVAPLLAGRNPFAWADEKAHIASFDSAAEATRPVVLFLGLDERGHGKDLSKDLTKDAGGPAPAAKDEPPFEYRDGEYRGIPYFAVDVTPRGTGALADAARAIIESAKAKGLTFLAGVRHVTTLNAPEGKSSPACGV